MSQRNKLIIAILLLVVLGVVIGLQFAGVFPRPGGGRSAKRPPTAKVQRRAQEKPAQGAAEAPSASQPKEELARSEKPPAEASVASETAKQGLEESKQGSAPSVPGPAEPTAPKVVKALPKLGFLSEDVEERFQSSRFFARAPTTIEKDPFQPAGTAVLPLPAETTPTSVLEKMFTAPSGEKPAPTETSPAGTAEVPLLPLPSQPLAPSVKVTLLGVCKGAESTTALITVSDESGKTTQKFFARPGWLVGQDYIFLGLSNGFANLLDRKTNQVIQLKTGGTL